MFTCGADALDEARQCGAVRSGEPWSLQIDTHQVARIAHELLNGAPLVVRRDATTQRWQPTTRPKELHQTALWNALFDALLNAADDVAGYEQSRLAFEQYLTANAAKAKTIKQALCRQQIMLYELSQN